VPPLLLLLLLLLPPPLSMLQLLLPLSLEGAKVPPLLLLNIPYRACTIDAEV
jgi:hypothetical protein